MKRRRRFGVVGGQTFKPLPPENKIPSRPTDPSSAASLYVHTHPATVSCIMSGEKLVELPRRFLRESTTGSLEEPSSGLSQAAHNAPCTEEDLKTALVWIRQEIFQMRQLDRSLTKQLLDIDNAITEFKDTTTAIGENVSDSRISLISDLDIPSVTTYRRYPLQGDSGMIEYRVRTVSTVLPPNSQRLSRNRKSSAPILEHTSSERQQATFILKI
ncbi:uncharacterized protein LOC141910105 [Tubulanus polymorphus]|uniref:uncharacterized protein LOC141910105 n=1 Tax=Tubulanus polymorphus TaxID=672921 RepID=UPI003DA30C88